ncbi:MAG TPA: hypothetical protein VJR49_02480, partial [Chthoniobacterales bacterium]|nr:hypothetical protein [Chthoniobacterales bacterium]
MSYGSAVLEDVTGSPEVNSDIVAAPQDAAGDLPAWFRQQRGQGWREFSALPMPTRKDQAWRFSNVGALDLTPYRFGTVASEDEQGEILERSTALNGKAGRVIFANDQLLERDALPESLRKAGVVFQPLERALIEHEDLVRKHFMAQPAALGS